MKAFADTSFLFALYRQQDNSHLADAFVSRSGEPIHASSLVIYEFRQSARFQAFRHTRDRTTGFSKRLDNRMHEDLHVNINNGAIVLIPFKCTKFLSTSVRQSS